MTEHLVEDVMESSAEVQGPGGPASARPPLAFTVGALVTGLVGATLVVDQRPGLNIVLFAAAAGLAVALARPQAPKPDAALFGVLVFALVALSLVRAAEWITILAFLAAVLGAPLALGGATSWRGAADSLLAPVRGAIAGPALVVRPISSGGTADRAGFLRPVLRGAAAGGLLLAIFAPLFLSADAVFSRLASDALPDWDLGTLPARAFVFLFSAAGVGALALAAPRFRPIADASRLSRLADAVLKAIGGMGRRADPGGTPGIRLVRPEWAFALGLLDLLFASFVAVQITVLFAGHDHVLSSTGLTYAEYARQGFAQLVVASGLTLLVVAGAVWLCENHTPRDRLLLRLLLGLLCLLTLVILASALKRLLLYEEAFGYTRARLLAHAIMFWLALLFLLILVAGAVGRSRWLPRTALAVSLASVLALGAADPDRLIAARNIDRYRQTGKLDLRYLEKLSVDALSSVRELPQPVRTCILESMASRLPPQEPWYAYNVRRSAGRSALERFFPAEGARRSGFNPVCDTLSSISPA